MKRDEEHAKQIMAHHQDMTNHFDVTSHPDKLYNISTGMYASEDVQASLLEVVEKGKKEFEKFVDFRFSTDAEPSYSFQTGCDSSLS